MGFARRFSRWLWSDGQKRTNPSLALASKGSALPPNEGADDLVVVTVDGRCLVGMEIDDFDWSVGWEEPHHPDFRAGRGEEGGFAVLVPVYRKGEGWQCGPAESYRTRVLAAVSVPEDKKYLEDLLSSQQGN